MDKGIDLFTWITIFLASSDKKEGNFSGPD